MIQIRHNYDDVAYYMQKDYPVYVKDVRGRYLPMVIYGVRVDKRDGKLKLRVNGARSKWLKAKNHHVIYTDASEGPATRENYQEEENRRSRRTPRGFSGITGMSNMVVSGTYMNNISIPVVDEPTMPVIRAGDGTVVARPVEPPEDSQIRFVGGHSMPADVTPEPQPVRYTGSDVYRRSVEGESISSASGLMEQVAQIISDGTPSYTELVARARNYFANSDEITRVVDMANRLIHERINRPQQRNVDYSRPQTNISLYERTRGIPSRDRVQRVVEHVFRSTATVLSRSEIEVQCTPYANTMTELGQMVEGVYRLRRERQVSDELEGRLTRPLTEEPRSYRMIDDEDNTPF